MDTYIITAKTVEEAISSAKKQYEDENHEVSYEILEMPKKGFLGLGAKDAKVKITVSKTEKVELGSLVAEMRSMKNLTDRSGSSDPEKPAKKPEQKQPREPKPQQNQQNQPKPQNQQPRQPKPQGQQNQPKEQKPQNPQNQQPKEPKQPKPQNPQNQQPKEPKEPKPQNPQPKEPKQPKPADGQNPQPKQPRPQNPQPKEPKEPKPADAQNQQPKEPKEPKEPRPVKTESAAEAAAAAAEKTAPETAAETAAAEAETSRLDAAILSATTVTTKFGDAGAEYKTSLHNSSRPNRRAPQKHGSNPEEKIDAGAVTVSQPMGLTDFVADPNAQGFGKNGSNAAGGRMNNDVRKKKKNNAPKNDKKPESTVARYDFAESDDDYEKLDRLVSEAESELEAAQAAVLVPKMPAVPEKPEETEDSDAEELAPARENRRREAITQAEMDYALEFANTLLANMKLEARAVPAECPEGEEFDTTEEATVYPKIDIVGDDTGILIGHHGETLDSIQYLVNLSALRKTRSKDGDYVKIVVDIENYREKREDTLRTLARRMAARAVKYKRNVFLEPMNAYERRIIHSELQSFENVSTHSVGADRDRKIIITYEGPDKQPDNRQNNAGRRRRGDKAPAEESGANASANPENGAAKENGGNGGRSRRRPRKAQKMPIEKLDELLPGGDEFAAVTEAAAEAVVETVVEAAVEAVEVAEAAAAAEPAAEQAVSEAAESAQPDEE